MQWRATVGAIRQSRFLRADIGAQQALAARSGECRGRLGAPLLCPVKHPDELRLSPHRIKPRVMHHYSRAVKPSVYNLSQKFQGKVPGLHAGEVARAKEQSFGIMKPRVE